MTWALGEVGEEVQTCSVYFTVISGCLGHQRPDLSESYLQAAGKLALLGSIKQAERQHIARGLSPLDALMPARKQCAQQCRIEQEHRDPGPENIYYILYRGRNEA